MTEQDTGFQDWVPLAPRQELAPVSRTSVVFDSAKWPFKPDVVAEGGNFARDPELTRVDTPDSLAILTTGLMGINESTLTTTRDTSAATSLVASIAAQIWAEYPNLWPETVRGLVVHSAEWTPRMLDHLHKSSLKRNRVALLRRYGMGVPDLSRAIRSATDSLTLISQTFIQPYEPDSEGSQSSQGKICQMNIHELPWPNAILSELGESMVRMRITLSYFIEPNPSNRGWSGRYAYPSHALRFAVRHPEESTEEFNKRINKRATAMGETVPRTEDRSDQWRFGKNQHDSAGSLHTDIWEGPAAELARRGVIAVYPVSGWWKENMAKGGGTSTVRYALIVNIDTPDIDVDIWTPVKNEIATIISI
jgi:hypothetical protein